MDRVLVLIFGVGLGYVLIRYNAKMKEIVGSLDWVDKYLGAGGTYLFLKLVGLLLIVFSFLYAVGTLQDILGEALQMFVPGARQ